MEIVAHHPKQAEGMRNLQNQAASIYARAAFLYLKRLPCPLEQKLFLLDRLKRALERTEI